MRDEILQLRHQPLFRAAMVVPLAITLLFSFFNLTAPPDPARLAAALRLGVVNADAGMRLPPINVGERLVEGMGARLPFGLVPQPDAAVGRAALERGELSALLVLPERFTAEVIGGEAVSYQLLLAENLPAAEAQIAGQLPMMLDTAVSAAVLSIRLSLAKGQMPNPTLPVAGSVERLYPLANEAGRVAPFVAVFTTWLAALVGALLMNRATLALAPAGAARMRSVLPVVATGLSSLALAVLILCTAGLAGGFWAFWLAAWALSLVLVWGFAGILAWTGPVALLVLVPLAFYQAGLGGAQIPVAAAPGWLQAAALGLPFERVGALYRGLILGAPTLPGPAPLLLVAALGLALIWLRPLLGRRMAVA